jgi:hypothetical protein
MAGMTHLLRRAGHFLCAVIVLSAVPAVAQTSSADEQEVLATVQRIFDAMGKCDPPTIRALTLPEGRLFRLTPGGNQPPRSQTLDEFAAQFTPCTRKLVERSWSPQVRVHKGIATFWAPYDFWIDGTFSHCGIDSFELVKTGGAWKLTSGIYTVERERCAPSPLGPLQP